METAFYSGTPHNQTRRDVVCYTTHAVSRACLIARSTDHRSSLQVTEMAKLLCTTFGSSLRRRLRRPRQPRRSGAPPPTPPKSPLYSTTTPSPPLLQPRNAKSSSPATTKATCASTLSQTDASYNPRRKRTTSTRSWRRGSAAPPSP